MENFVFYRPTKYFFGRGESNFVGKRVSEAGKKRVMIVYGQNSAAASGLLEKVKHSLEENHIEFTAIGGVKPNPEASFVQNCIDEGRSFKPDLILAVGGGSVIDTAKAAALGILHRGDFFSDFFLEGKNASKALPVAVVLTIPGSGSEGSQSAVIQREVSGLIIKKGYTSDLMVPVFAILDPDLTMSLPSYQTASGAVDMMAHVMERYFTNTRDVAITDRLCEGILLSIVETLPRILEEPDNYGARANLMWAGMLAHNDICGVGREQDWASHHLELQLSALYDCTHGAGLAVIFPAWMEYTLNHNVLRFAQFACRVFGVEMDFQDPVNTAKAGIRALKAFLRRIGMPLCFAELGARTQDIPLLLNMLKIDEHPEGHFVVLNREDCQKIYEMAADLP